MNYFKYINAISYYDRGFEDIFMIRPELLAEVFRLEDQDKYIEFEELIKKEDLKINMVKKIVNYLNWNYGITVEEAYNKICLEEEQDKVKRQAVDRNFQLHQEIKSLEEHNKIVQKENNKLRNKQRAFERKFNKQIYKRKTTEIRDAEIKTEVNNLVEENNIGIKNTKLKKLLEPVDFPPIWEKIKDSFYN